MFKVIKNFLPTEDFKKINQLILNDHFPWYFQEARESIGDWRNDLTQYQLTHLFYENPKINSDYFNVLSSLLDKLKIKSLIKVKANLNPYSEKLSEGYFHKDFKNYNCFTAVYYVNSNNGYTLFESNKQKILSEENKIVIFNSEMLHKGTNTTDSKKRVVLNINYF